MLEGAFKKYIIFSLKWYYIGAGGDDIYKLLGIFPYRCYIYQV